MLTHLFADLERLARGFVRCMSGLVFFVSAAVARPVWGLNGPNIAHQFLLKAQPEDESVPRSSLLNEQLTQNPNGPTKAHQQRPNEAPSAIAYGGGNCGKLQGGEAMPCSGDNFEAYTETACALGRNFLHPLVQLTLLKSYAAIKAQFPERRWQFGELGRPSGGPLWPHKTHQNGLSADFFVPVLNATKSPASLPILAVNRYGYGLEFNRLGALGTLHIDWKALADHLLALEAAGADRGVSIERVIITPDFHRALFEQAPELLPLRRKFMLREAWVRHDEHYHVDFAIPDAFRKPLRCRR
jgi:penicillin-insensitive murein DD-endopeptidase